MGWGALGSIADGAKSLAGGAADLAKDAGKAFDDALDAAGDAASAAGRAVSNASISDIGHTSLDVLGMVPVVGEVADLANAGWYAAEGDYTNAALSAAGAIPFAGNAATAAKWGKKAVDAADVASDALKLADNAGDAAKAVDSARAVARTDVPTEPQVLFGQRRVSPTFSKTDPKTGKGPPEHLAGRPISDVAADLKSGKINPDDVPVQAFRHGDELVSTNTRSLAALSEAGIRPTNVKVVEPTRSHLRRLDETPIIPNADLPATRVPVTPSHGDHTVLRVIEIPRGIH